MNTRDYAEFEQPLSMLLDGTLTPEQKQTLQGRLETDQGFRRFYVEYMKIHTLLRGELEGRLLEGLPADIEGIQAPRANKPEHVSATAAPSGLRSTSSAPTTRPTFRLGAATRYLSIAAGFLLVVATLFWVTQQFSSRAPVLASVTNSRGAYWQSDPSRADPNPDRLAAGAYDLRAGQLELTFTDGTVATLDAPAHFVLQADDHLHLARGRVYVIAEEGASGFRVSTPDALAVDLGTEFGVAYDPGQATRVHVFKGAVNISESLLNAQGEPTVTGDILKLGESQSGSVTPGEGPAMGPSADANLFVRDVDGLAGTAPAKPTLRSWHAYRDRLSADPDLVAAYDFTRRGRASRSLPNIARVTGNRLNGVLGDKSIPNTAPRWTTGRFPGSHALLFNPTDKQFVGLPADDSLKISGDLTTVWWMMPRSTIHRDFSMVVLGCGGPREDDAPETAAENHMYAHGLKRGYIRAFHESAEGENQEVLAAPQIRPDTWVHVAIVRDTDDKAYHIYLNGRLADSLSYKRNVTGGDSQGVFPAIGRSGGARLNHFDGKIDDLMIYRRALTDIEVADHFQQSRPDMPE